MLFRTIFSLTILVAMFLPFGNAEAQQSIPLTKIRVAHFSPDTPAVEIYLDGQLSGMQALSFGDMSGWVELPAGRYSIAVAPAGTSIDDAAIGPATFDLRPGAWTTVAAIGSLGNGTLGATTVSETYSTLPADESNVTVFHGIENAPAVDVILPDGTALISGLSFGESANLTVPTGTYDLAVVASGTTGPAVIDLAGTTLAGQTFYFVAATNALANPQVVLNAIGFSTVESLIDNSAPSASIAEIAASDSRFDTLVAALDAAGLVETLDNGGPFTVFAPTDTAFAALLSELGISASDLLANTDLLTDVLLYHVFEGRALATDVVGVESINMLRGSVNVSVTDEGVFLNDNIQIIITDIQGTNGVIHVIDSVLLP